MSTAAINRLYGVISRIQEDLLEEAFCAVLARYGLSIMRLTRPLISFSDERVPSRYTPNLCSGSTDMKSIMLYTQGILERVALGGTYELVALNAHIHERVHMLAGEREAHGRHVRIHDTEVRARVKIGGFRVSCTLEFPTGFREQHLAVRSGTALDEGMTELFAREVMSMYLAMDPTFAKVTEAHVLAHREGWSTGAEFTFYPLALRFLYTLVRVLSKRHGHEHSEWTTLYRDYLIGTNVLVEPSWKRRLDECDITSIVHKALGCKYAELESLELTLRENFL